MNRGELKTLEISIVTLAILTTNTADMYLAHITCQERFYVYYIGKFT